MPADIEVLKAVQLLMNARARREAVSSLDRGQYEEARSFLKQAKDQTQVLYSMAPAASLVGDEIGDFCPSPRKGLIRIFT